ncbi:hypothetical protein L6R29_21360, partial [Myxococcota bacterium]|nr:hypothetical protein [Myxococcota bacterium]
MRSWRASGDLWVCAGPKSAAILAEMTLVCNAFEDERRLLGFVGEGEENEERRLLGFVGEGEENEERRLLGFVGEGEENEERRLLGFVG